MGYMYVADRMWVSSCMFRSSHLLHVQNSLLLYFSILWGKEVALIY